MSDGDFQTTDSISEVTNDAGVTIGGVTWNLQSRPVRRSRRGARAHGVTMTNNHLDSLITLAQQLEGEGIRAHMEAQTGIRWMDHAEYLQNTTTEFDHVVDIRSPTVTEETLTAERLRGYVQDPLIDSIPSSSPTEWNLVNGPVPTPNTTTPFVVEDYMTPELRQYIELELERNRRLIYGPAIVTSTPVTSIPVHIESPEHYNFQIAVDAKPYKDILDENLKQHWRIRGEH